MEKLLCLHFFGSCIDFFCNLVMIMCSTTKPVGFSIRKSHWCVFRESIRTSPVLQRNEETRGGKVALGDRLHLIRHLSLCSSQCSQPHNIEHEYHSLGMGFPAHSTSYCFHRWMSANVMAKHRRHHADENLAARKVALVHTVAVTLSSLCAILNCYLSMISVCPVFCLFCRLPA